ncbi:hypothetical protein [Streptomyces sp. NPDC005408]|uniref:hypothetical protein n=1 Tax=Streptomyces sp. NPDC005408 TaxID=3155341 RepID=UPI0033A8CDD6
MSEASRNGTEPPKDIAAMFKRTRDLSDRIGALEEQKLGDRLAELALVVQKLADKPESQSGGVWNWSGMTPGQQASAWEYLLAWMETILKGRFPSSYEEMLRAGCWHEHPDVVEELTSLCTTWLWSYQDKEAGPLRTAEWLDRWLPACVRHVKLILENCSPQHTPPLQRHDRAMTQVEALQQRIAALKAQAAQPGG